MRAMVKFGIKAMDRYTHPPIEAIIDEVGKGNIDSDRIAFFIAPLLNSAGRLKDAKYGVEFLLSETIDEAKI